MNRPQNPAQPNTTPIPPSGSYDDFSYAPSRYDGVSVVYPTDGSEPLLVSTSFLETSIKSSPDSSMVVNDVKAYQQMNNQVAEQFSDSFYPDASAGNANVQRSVIQGADRDVIIEQDPKAGPYARITVTDKEGNILSESSMSASAAAKISGSAMDVETKINAFNNNKFTLPERARENFNSLSPEELREIVLDNPAIQQQEFVKFAKVMAQEKARQEGRAGGVVADGQGTGTVSGVNELETTGTANAAQRQVDERDIALDEMDVEAGVENERDGFDSAGLEPRDNGLGVPEIAGILLGLVAIGIFVFGWWKTKQ